MKIKLYVLALLIFLGIDALWLGLVAPDFYRSQIGHLMAETPNLYAAGVFYLLFVRALVYFVIEPALRIGNTRDVWVRGALFGLVTYATYDLTNLATPSAATEVGTVADRAWGTARTVAAAGASVWAGRKIL